MRLCLDTGLLMRGVEGLPEVRAAVVQVLRRTEHGPGGAVVASELARAECLVIPIREHNTARYQEFLSFFSESGIEMISVTAEILAMATAVRAHQGLKMVDAIQVATAQITDCEVLLTTDGGIVKRGPYGKVRVEHFPP
jgi:predicted nucleic acid-binding protein